MNLNIVKYLSSCNRPGKGLLSYISDSHKPWINNADVTLEDTVITGDIAEQFNITNNVILKVIRKQ